MEFVAGVDAEFGVGVGDVGFDRSFADDESFRDFTGGEASVDERDDFAFTSSESGAGGASGSLGALGDVWDGVGEEVVDGVDDSVGVAVPGVVVDTVEFDELGVGDVSGEVTAVVDGDDGIVFAGDDEGGSSDAVEYGADVEVAHHGDDVADDAGTSGGAEESFGPFADAGVVVDGGVLPVVAAVVGFEGDVFGRAFGAGAPGVVGA